MLQRASDYRSNENDQIVYAANKIGKSALKQAVFKAVYFGKQKTKTVDEVCKKAGLSRKAVLDTAKILAHAQLFHQVKDKKGGIAYQKDADYIGVWKKVLAAAGNKKKLGKIPTKVRPLTSTKTVTIKIPKSQVQIDQLTIDDIESFQKVRKVKTANAASAKISEAKMKKGIVAILGESKLPNDWGGEQNDIYTTNLVIKSKRYAAAFALKGPGKKVKELRPKDMGKNGDQIQRLLDSPAQVLLVQYWGEIDQSVVKQMETLVTAKSFSQGRKIYYGIINGQDSARLIQAYPKKFN